MKKILLILLLGFLFTSCDDRVHVEETNDKTELSYKVHRAIGDTTLTFDYAVVESENHLYLLQRSKDNSKVDVSYKVEKTSKNMFGLGVFVGAVAVLLTFAFIALFTER